MPTHLTSLLLLALSATLPLGTSGRAGAASHHASSDRPSAGTALRIPELLAGDRGDDGVVRFEIDVRAGTTQFRDGPPTQTWGVNGSYLGPTLRASRGDVVEVAVHNGVEEVTTMHWHGMNVPAQMDGGPYQPIDPGDTWRPTWTVDQPAATLWYHPHPHGNTAAQVFRGVAGMFIVDDGAVSALGLPHDYGVDDLPVIIQDRTFDGDNQFVGDGKQVGDEVLVNGTLDPYVDVTHERVRLRLLNASGTLVYDLGFADGRPFELVGTDGGLLPAPVTLDRVPLSPGERAEIVVTVEPDERAVLRSLPPAGASGIADGGAIATGAADVLELRAAPELVPSAAPPAQLVDVERLDPADAVATRTFRLTGTQINGQGMSTDRIDLSVAAGSVEIWEVVVEAGEHNFHIHGVQFQVLDIDGEPPPPHLLGWKDTVAVADGTTTRLIVPFGTHTDPDVPYMYHCHKLRHEDLGMMGQFVVVGLGDAADTAAPVATHEHH